ncbi:hypothetical protein AMTR_s00068p00121760 [Amborella trichopoda]|uniref:Uncharacterized protein n=1 Tax=Amborella trichopoda TaxID=13333 RepID=U5DD26_AMBTC|nr:hypothetical protein AMTR_s00068p00121760 [Amborella trichopoda]
MDYPNVYGYPSLYGLPELVWASRTWVGYPALVERERAEVWVFFFFCVKMADDEEEEWKPEVAGLVFQMPSSSETEDSVSQIPAATESSCSVSIEDAEDW